MGFILLCVVNALLYAAPCYGLLHVTFNFAGVMTLVNSLLALIACAVFTLLLCMRWGDRYGSDPWGYMR